MSETKTCSKCGEVKAVEMFRVWRNRCKVCQSQLDAISKQKRKSEIQKYNRIYQEANSKTLREKRVAKYSENAKQIREKLKEWRIKNPEKMRQYTKTQQSRHPKRIAATKKEWSQKNMEKIVAFQRQERAKLGGSYVKSVIAKATRTKQRAIPTELIEVKRKHLQILRAIKEQKHER